jgi:hypothetical protein
MAHLVGAALETLGKRAKSQVAWTICVLKRLQRDGRLRMPQQGVRGLWDRTARSYDSRGLR